MSYVNLYAVTFDSLKGHNLKAELIENYKKKEAAVEGLNPKPIRVKGGYVLYIWSHSSENAKAKAERILNERIHH